MNKRILAEYIWIDGTKPVPKLRSKTKVIEHFIEHEGYLNLVSDSPRYFDVVPVWGFDGSSTKQADGNSSDCILKPVRFVKDPLRGGDNILVLCEVLNADENPNRTNFRAELAELYKDAKDQEPWFGIEQEYTFFKGRSPLGWPEGGYPAPQGPFYCGVGSDEVFGREIVEEHMKACVNAGILISGVNAEVMPGQWEFQIGPGDPLMVSDHIWLARYILYKIAEEYGVTVKLDPKPIEGDWNGAGAHTNFSTKFMRHGDGPIGGIAFCKSACDKLGEDFHANGFPQVYGHGYENRLTGAHETCSYKEFKYGVSDRTASLRIPLQVEVNGQGYIEDRRPCANIDPYRVCTYLIKTVCK